MADSVRVDAKRLAASVFPLPRERQGFADIEMGEGTGTAARGR
jgi:hypothetical protein